MVCVPSLQQTDAQASVQPPVWLESWNKNEQEFETCVRGQKSCSLIKDEEQMRCLCMAHFLRSRSFSSDITLCNIQTEADARLEMKKYKHNYAVLPSNLHI